MNNYSNQLFACHPFQNLSSVDYSKVRVPGDGAYAPNDDVTVEMVAAKADPSSQLPKLKPFEFDAAPPPSHPNSVISANLLSPSILKNNNSLHVPDLSDVVICSNGRDAPNGGGKLPSLAHIPKHPD